MDVACAGIRFARLFDDVRNRFVVTESHQWHRDCFDDSYRPAGFVEEVGEKGGDEL